MDLIERYTSTSHLPFKQGCVAVASVRSRAFMLSPHSVWFNQPHPLPLYYHQPPLASCLALHQQTLQLSVTRQIRPGCGRSRLPTAASSACCWTWHHCYLGKITVEGAADSLISLISLLACSCCSCCCWTPHKQAFAHSRSHTHLHSW